VDETYSTILHTGATAIMTGEYQALTGAA